MVNQILKRLHIPYIKEKSEPKECIRMGKTICIECKQEVAMYWGDNFCEDCIKQIFKEEYKTDGESKSSYNR